MFREYLTTSLVFTYAASIQPSGHLMNTFLIKARTRLLSVTFRAQAPSSSEAAARVAALFGDEPCGITVTCLE